MLSRRKGRTQILGDIFLLISWRTRLRVLSCACLASACTAKTKEKAIIKATVH